MTSQQGGHIGIELAVFVYALQCETYTNKDESIPMRPLSISEKFPYNGKKTRLKGTTRNFFLSPLISSYHHSKFAFSGLGQKFSLITADVVNRPQCTGNCRLREIVRESRRSQAPLHLVCLIRDSGQNF